MMNAQYTLVANLNFFDPESPNYRQAAVTIMSPLRNWLMIESSIFFIYIFSASLFMIIHMCKGWCGGKKNGEKVVFSNKRKQITDFVIYEEYNLLWYGFNCVLVGTPAFVIFYVWVEQIERIAQADDGLFDTILITILIGCMFLGQLLQIICLPKIYDYE